jgi:ketosteroid isomerase-like protein/quercetin dioxygenase-like cupin family protein
MDRTLGAEEEIHRLLDELVEAHLRSDAAALDRLRADDYVLTTADGRFLDKAQTVLVPDDWALTAYAHEDVRVRVYGDAAVATGVLTVAGTYRGQARDTRSRWTRVFVKQDGRWQVVANQVTHITAAGAGPGSAPGADPAAHYALAADEGEAIWFLGNLLTVTAFGAATGGALAVLESLGRPGAATPRHVHWREDEAFYVLDGALRGYCGDQEWRGAGDVRLAAAGRPPRLHQRG